MKLHEQVKRLQQDNAILMEGLYNIECYLALKKFQVDTTVNKDDILLRVNEIKQQIWGR